VDGSYRALPFFSPGYTSTVQYTRVESLFQEKLIRQSLLFRPSVGLPHYSLWVVGSMEAREVDRYASDCRVAVELGYRVVSVFLGVVRSIRCGPRPSCTLGEN
jgi:hypothetical protein